MIRGTLNYMRNPLKDLRLSLRLTIDDVIERSEISRSAILANEAGCYSNPSPRLLDFYEIDPISDRSFLDRYHEFQFYTRRENFGLLRVDVLASLIRRSDSLRSDSLRSDSLRSDSLRSNLFSPAHSFPLFTNPIESWRVRSELSKARISKAYCIHPDIVSRIECRPHLMPIALPEQFLKALLMSGYSKSDMESLNGLFRNYRETVTGTIKQTDLSAQSDLNLFKAV